MLSGRKVFQKLLFGELKFKHPMSDKEVWMWLYSDPYNCAHFNAWLKLVLSLNEPDIGEDFKSTELSRFAGFLTYRYLRLYTIGNGLNRIGSFDALRNYDRTENFLDETIKMERVNLDIERLATRFKISRASSRRILHRFKRKPNKSKREEDYRYYYTADSVELVQAYEKLIIEKHNYAFE